MNASRRALAVLAFAVAAQSFPATAGDAPNTGKDLFQRGRHAMNDGQYDLAVRYFEQSQEIEPALGNLLNIAVCEERLGRVASALGHLREALAQASPGDKRRPLVAERIAELEKRVALVTLRLEGPEGTDVTVSLDGRPLGRADLGKVLTVDPGAHALECAGPQGERCAQLFTLSAGEKSERAVIVTTPAPPTVELAPKDPPAPPQVSKDAPVAPQPAAKSRALAFGLGALGIAGIGTSLVTGLMVIDRKKEMEGNCLQGRCNPEGIAAAESGKTLSLVSTLAMGVGVIAIGSSAYLLLSAPTSKNGMTTLSFVGAF
jgi:hypothetical protein